MTLVRCFRLVSAALCVLLSALATPAFAQAGRYDAFYVFGDSLADTGNVWLTSKLLNVSPAPPPSEGANRAYFEGRFSNGPVAFEYLWDQLRAGTTLGPMKPFIAAPVLAKTGAVNFAFGGTGTPMLDQTPGGLWAPGLLGQVELFRLGLRGRRPSTRALYAIVTGANDYRQDRFNPVPLTPDVVVGNIAIAIQRLYAVGARDILVLTLPNLSCLPYGQTACVEPLADVPLAAQHLPPGAMLAAGHNELLRGAVQTLAQSLPGANVRLLDVNPVFAAMRTAFPPADITLGPGVVLPFWALPGLDALVPLPLTGPDGAPILQDGSPVPVSACLFVDPALCPPLPSAVFGANAAIQTPPDSPLPIPPGVDLLFWDVLHPTTRAHSTLADAMFAALAHLP